MPVTVTIATLAGAVLAQMPGLSAEQRLSLQLLQDMQAWRARQCLDDWADAFCDAQGEDASPNARLIAMIFELAQVNLYTLFDAGRARHALRAVHAALTDAGYAVPRDLDVSCW
ncbi:MAG: hypothetical protein V4582_21685 [Pseudomonadota bacterium]